MMKQQEEDKLGFLLTSTERHVRDGQSGLKLFTKILEDYADYFDVERIVDKHNKFIGIRT